MKEKISIRGITPPKGSRFAKGGSASGYARSQEGAAPLAQSIRHRIHTNGHIIGGLHDRGIKHAESGRTTGLGYFDSQVSKNNIVVEKNARGQMRYKIKKTPSIPWGAHDELALLRAQHFLRDNQNKWMTQCKFREEFRSVYDNFVNAFKF